MNIWSAFHSDTQSTNGNMNTETHISSLKHCGTFMCASFISTAGQRPWMLRTLSKCSFVQYQYQYVCISNVSVSIGYHHRFWPPPAADADLFWFCSLFRLCGWPCFLLRVVQIAAVKCWKRAFHSILKYIIYIPTYSTVHCGLVYSQNISCLPVPLQCCKENRMFAGSRHKSQDVKTCQCPHFWHKKCRFSRKIFPCQNSVQTPHSRHRWPQRSPFV